MARQSKLTNAEWDTIIQLKADGFTYQQLSAKYGVSKQAINARLTKKSNSINNKQDITKAECYSAAKLVVVNHFINEHVTVSNSILDLHKKHVKSVLKLQQILETDLEDELSISQLEQYANVSKNITNQIIQLSKIYGMEDLSHKLNQQHVDNVDTDSQNSPQTKKNRIIIRMVRPFPNHENYQQYAQNIEEDAQRMRHDVRKDYTQLCNLNNDDFETN